MQGSIQERFIKLRSRIIYRASKPLHSSEQIIGTIVNSSIYSSDGSIH